MALSEKEIYRALCRTEVGIPLFSRDWWLDAACGADRWDALVVEERGRIVAAMPLYTPLAGAVTMPCYTQTMGPWIAPLAADTKYASALVRRQELMTQLLERIEGHRFFLQNSHHTITDWLPFYWAGYTQTTRYTYLLHTISDTDALQERMSQNIRRNLVKARDRHGITVRTGLSIDALLAVQEQTFERQGITNKQDSHVLRRLVEAARSRGQGEIFGGYDAEGRLHAAVFVVWQPSGASYIAGGSHPEWRRSGAHALTLWEAILHAAQFTDTFDLEGSMLRGVERFFREFGGVQTPYFCIRRGRLSLLDRARMKLMNKGK